MAAYLGLNDFFVKDESYRFGLNAFKVLGGSFAMANYIAEKLKKDVSELTYDELTSDQLRSAFGQATFLQLMVTMDEESLGLRINGQKSVVLMPKGSTQTRKENIEKKAQPSQLKKLITMNVYEWLIKWPKKLKTVSWFKTPLGTDMKNSDLDYARIRNDGVRSLSTIKNLALNDLVMFCSSWCRQFSWGGDWLFC